MQWLLTVGRAGLALAVIAVVVSGDDRRINIDGIGDRLAETVAGERHFDWMRKWRDFDSHKVLR